MRRFPIMRNYSTRARPPGAVQPRTSIPWDLIAPHEARAQRNHGQTLERLAERQGLSPTEALCILLDKPWQMRELHDADARLDELVAAFEKKTDG